MSMGGVIKGTLNISITTLVDDVGLCRIGINEALTQIASRIDLGWRGGAIDIGAEGRDEPLQRIYWDYESPDGPPKKLLGIGNHLLH